MTDSTISQTDDAERVCPVSGLPIQSRPEWTDLAFGSRYRLTTRVVGNRILLTQPAGFAEVKDIADSLELTDAIVREHIDGSGGYVHISDYSGMRGITREARKHYVRHMERREKLLGQFYFGVSPFFSAMIKLFKRLSLVKFNVQIVDDYAAAMSTALRLIGDEPGKAFHGGFIDPFQDRTLSEHIEMGRRILRCDDWRLDLDGYSVVAEVIDGRIYHAVSSGTLREHHVDPVAELRERVRRTIGLKDGFVAIVTGTADAHASHRGARRRYMASLRTWHDQYPMLLYIFYNANRFIRTAAMLAIPFMPFKVKVARDLAGAMALVDRFAGFREPSAQGGPAAMGTVAEDPPHVVHQLLQFIGDIDWERRGAPTPDHVDPAHPFRPVFDAIALIKAELDSLFDERRQAERALLESRKRFEEVLKHSRDILFKRNLKDGTYEYVSDAVLNLLGLTPDDVCQMSFGGVQAMVHPEDLSRFLRFNKGLRENVGATADHVIEYRLRDSQGRYRWFSDSHSIVHDEAGRPAFVIGSNRDITDHKAAEQELKDSHERFTTVLDSISAHIYVADLETFEILFMNRAMRDDFGDYHPGDRCFEVFCNAAGACPHCTNGKLLDDQGRPTGVHTWEGLNPKRNRWYLNHDQAIRWVDGRMVRLQIAMDISRIKSLESERQEIAERLRHTRKLEAVNTMAGGVAHHFNNLLMVVLGNLELMRMSVAADNNLVGKIDAAEKSARRAADLSSLMLTYVGQTRISPQTVDLGSTLAEMVSVLQTTVADKATLTLLPADASVYIHADASKVCQVITNLVTNAVEASGDDPLEIQLGVGSQLCDAVQLSRLAPGEHLAEGRYVWLRVSDNGRGMDQETLEKVFDPFFTTKFTGRGLGMAAVMGIVKAHRGGIRIDSRPDAGTAVTVYFPEHRLPLPAEPASTPPFRKHRKSALVVDDEPLVLELGKQMLVMMGFDVLTAPDGQAALKMVEENPGQIGIALVDITMPRMNGRETVERMRAMGAAFPILVSSGFNEAQAQEKMGHAAVDGYIQKPFRIDQLREKIDAISNRPAK